MDTAGCRRGFPRSACLLSPNFEITPRLIGQDAVRTGCGTALYFLAMSL
jgi:hypothetical protein